MRQKTLKTVIQYHAIAGGENIHVVFSARTAYNHTMDTLFDHIERNNWEGFEAQLNTLTFAEVADRSLAAHALEHERVDMLEDILDRGAHLVPEAHSSQTHYVDSKTSLALQAMTLNQHACFAVIFDRLDTYGHYQCLRDSVVRERENFVKYITPKIPPQLCWQVLEYAAERKNPNILDHLLEVCPVPFTQEDEDSFGQHARFIADSAMSVINKGWNHCLERILNLTPKEYDSTEICVVACENENWEGARIALKFTSEDKVRAFNTSFDPQLTKRTVGHFLCLLEDERLNATLTNETSHIQALSARRKL